MRSLFETDPEVATNTSNSTNTHYQQGYYDKLLSGALGWLNSGGLQGGPNYQTGMENLLGQMGSGYADMISGKGSSDRYQNLMDMQKASAEIAGDELAKTNMGLQSAAGAAGQAGGSRQGIAQGLATSDAQTKLALQQSQMNQDFMNNEQALKQAGITGMGNLFGQIGQLQEMGNANTDQAKALQSLLAFQNMISGNMGGTQAGTTTGTVTGGGPSLGQSIIGGAVAGAGLSDKKLKKKIKKVKDKDGKKLKTKDGIDIAEWEWNEKANKKYGLKGKAEGVLAQEVEKKKPEAVVKNKKGDRMVNYGALM